MLKDNIRISILESKRERLIDCLKKVVTGQEPSFIYDYSKEGHYQIWFYHPFDFSYIFIGENNFTISISEKEDDAKMLQYRQEYVASCPDEESADQNFNNLLKEIEFDFFSDCWHELENQLSKNLRCFLIEYGIIRGFDVNKRIEIDGNDIK